MKVNWKSWEKIIGFSFFNECRSIDKEDYSSQRNSEREYCADLLDFCIEKIKHTFQLENDNNQPIKEIEEEQCVTTTNNNPTSVQQRPKAIILLVDASNDESIYLNASFLNAIERCFEEIKISKIVKPHLTKITVAFFFFDAGITVK